MEHTRFIPSTLTHQRFCYDCDKNVFILNWAIHVRTKKNLDPKEPLTTKHFDVCNTDIDKPHWAKAGKTKMFNEKFREILVYEKIVTTKKVIVLFPFLFQADWSQWEN